MSFGENAYNKYYNIEWYCASGRCNTTSAKLIKMADGYYYFEYPDGGVLIIEKRAIRSLDCLSLKEKIYG